MPHRSVAVRPLERPWLVMRQSAFIAPTDCDAEDRVLKLVAEANNALSTHDPARGNCSPQRNMVAGAPGAPQKLKLQKRTPDGHRWPSTGSTRLARVVKGRNGPLRGNSRGVGWPPMASTAPQGHKEKQK